MNIREKLALKKQADKRNEERVIAYIQKANIVDVAVEILARAILNRLDNNANRFGMKRSELLEMLVDTLWAMQQHDEQEDD